LFLKEASLGAGTPGRFNAQQRLVLPYHLYAAECLNRFGSGHLEVEKGRQKRDWVVSRLALTNKDYLMHSLLVNGVPKTDL